MKTYRRNSNLAPLFLIQSLNVDKLSTSTPRPFYPCQRTQVPTKCPVWTVLEKRKTSFPSRNSNPGPCSLQLICILTELSQRLLNRGCGEKCLRAENIAVWGRRFCPQQLTAIKSQYNSPTLWISSDTWLYFCKILWSQAERKMVLLNSVNCFT